MSLVAVLAAMLAAGLAFGPGPGVALARLSGRAEAHRQTRNWAGLVAAVCAAVAGLAAALLITGTRGLAVALAGSIVVVTVAVIVRGRLRTRRALVRRQEVAHASEVLGSLARIGHVPSAALAAAVRDCPVLARAAAVQHVGGDPVPVLRADAGLPGADGLLAIARAWQVTSETGAPIVASLDAVTAQLRATKELAHVVDSELAAPRATGQLLAGLPFAGLGLGFALGGDPLGFLTGSLVGQACLVCGVALAAAGVLWSEALADRAAQSAGV